MLSEGILHWLFILQVIITIGLIISEKIDKTLTVLTSSIFTIFLLRFGMDEEPGIIYEHFLDFHTLMLIIGLMIAVEIIKETGFFDYISLMTVKATKGDPLKLFIVFGIITILMTAFLDNVTAIILLASLTIVICERLELNPISFIMFEAYLTGVGALLTPIGSVPNIIINSQAKYSFIDFFIFMLPLTVVSVGITYAYFLFVFKADIAVTVPEAKKATVLLIQPHLALKQKNARILSSVIIIILVVGFIIAGFIELTVDVIALVAAVAALILFHTKPREGLKHVNWDMVFFFGGLFVVIGGLEHSGALHGIVDIFTELIQDNPVLALIILLIIGGILAAFLDSIPIALLLTDILALVGETEPVSKSFWMALVVATNVGGSLAPIGSVTVLMALEILREHDHQISPLEYIKYMFPLFLILSGIAFVYLWFFLS